MYLKKLRSTWPLIKKIAIIAIIIFAIGEYFYNKNIVKPPSVTWQMLGNIKFKEIIYDKCNCHVSVPVFSEELKKLNGKQVSIKGFFIPMKIQSKTFALSKNPNSTCFFCGGGTIETIVIVNCKEVAFDFPNDAMVTMSGRLELHQSFNEFIYTLENAE